jgi:fumarate reductase flavoprotein subunit
MTGAVEPADGRTFDADTDVVIIGAGAAGLIAALAAKQAGANPLIIERDAVSSGSTALSAGLIPAAGTRYQAQQGLADSVAAFSADILAKSHGTSDPVVMAAAVAAVGPALDWLGARFGLPFDVITDFRYPGHSAYRMHALPRRTGAELIDQLRAAAEREEIAILTRARATTLFVEPDGRITGIGMLRGGAFETLGCKALLLACNGYGGNRALVAEHLPSMADALWFGHSGNDGDAVLWGQVLGAELRDMSGHQGHGSVAQPHGILITWATMTEGGVQVNRDGVRFSDESCGYSEQGERVLAQPGAVAWSIFDARIAGIANQFEDFRTAEAQGAVVRAVTISELALAIGLPPGPLAATMAEVDAAKHAGTTDRFGRHFTGVAPLAQPYCAVKVTGALFHTQGGLAIDATTRVRRLDGSVLPNLFAAGGAAVGVSGANASGYLSGNGLLTAIGLGRLAGRAAARVATA